MTAESIAGWCEDYGDVTICGTDMAEYHREPMGERWCFLHRKREEFFLVYSAPTGLSYYGPSCSVEGPTRDCTDLFPGWSREWGGG